MMNKWFLPIVILASIGYCAFTFWFYQRLLLTVISALFCLFFILSSFIQKRKAEKAIIKFANEMSDNLELLFNCEFENVYALEFFDETLMAKINQKIVRIAEVLKSEKEKSMAEKKVLQSLISDLSHQLKTPMTNLKMLHETIQNGNLPEQTRNELLKLMESQLKKLEFLLSFMVKTSRLETGLIQLVKQQCNLFDTLAAALSGVTVAAEKKAIQIRVVCPEVSIVNHDPKWTAEALFNLLENAVKYSPHNSAIIVAVEKGEMYTQINITDQGQGIAETNLGKIFQRFYREQPNLEIEGLGIGLYLAREIIQNQNGYIMVRSVVGEGSTFSVFLANDF